MVNQTTGKSAAAVIPLVFILILSANAGAFGEVRLNPREEIVRIAELAEPLPLDALIQASLIASGTDAGSLDFYTEQIKGLIDSAPQVSGDDASDGEMLLKWMHEVILTRYNEQQTALDILLDRGTYNCVSSAVLYLILVRSRGIPVHGVLTIDHALCRIPAANEDGGFDVETTTAYGFDPGTRRDAVDSFTGRTGFSYIPPGNYRQRRDLGEKELISLIYQNRISALQKSGHWDETIGLARDRWELAGSDAAAADFRISITNHAADMDRRKRQIEGLRFLNDAAESLGTQHELEETASALLGNVIAYHLRAGRTAEAEAILEDEELTVLVPEEFLEERRRDARAKSLEVLVKSAPFEEAAAAVERAYSDDFIDRARWEEFSLYLWSTEARRRSSGGKWLEGWVFLMEAPAQTRSISRWDAMEETYHNNAVVHYHNRFADAVRKQRLIEARQILDEALAIFPEATVLIQDERTLDNL